MVVRVGAALTVAGLVLAGVCQAAPPGDTATAEVPLSDLEILDLMLEHSAAERRYETVRQQIHSDLDASTQGRFLYGNGVQTGVEIDPRMRVIRVVPGSPGAEAGIEPGDVVVEINDTVGGSGPEAPVRLLWAFRRLSPGDVAHVMVQRGERRLALQVPVISDEALQDLHLANAAARLDPLQARAAQRRERVERLQRRGIQAAHRSLGYWDGLLLVPVSGSLGGSGGGRQVGALVVLSADPDHPVRPGDVLLRIGHATPRGARHAAELLYGYETERWIPLEVARGRGVLALEVETPAVLRR